MARPQWTWPFSTSIKKLPKRWRRRARGWRDAAPGPVEPPLPWEWILDMRLCVRVTVTRLLINWLCVCVTKKNHYTILRTCFCLQVNCLFSSVCIFVFSSLLFLCACTIRSAHVLLALFILFLCLCTVESHSFFVMCTALTIFIWNLVKDKYKEELKYQRNLTSYGKQMVQTQ